jgi:hypothetical protein
VRSRFENTDPLRNSNQNRQILLPVFLWPQMNPVVAGSLLTLSPGCQA